MATDESEQYGPVIGTKISHCESRIEPHGHEDCCDTDLCPPDSQEQRSLVGGIEACVCGRHGQIEPVDDLDFARSWKVHEN